MNSERLIPSASAAVRARFFISGLSRIDVMTFLSGSDCRGMLCSSIGNTLTTEKRVGKFSLVTSHEKVLHFHNHLLMGGDCNPLKGKIMIKTIFAAATALLFVAGISSAQTAFIGGGSVAGAQSASGVGVQGGGGSAAGSIGKGSAVSANETFATGVMGNVSGATAKTTLGGSTATSGSLSAGGWNAGTLSASTSVGAAGGLAMGGFSTGAGAGGSAGAAGGSGAFISFP